MGKPQDAPSIGPPAIGILSLIVADILVLVVQDNKKRTGFTQGTIESTFSQYPKFNWVICHSPYTIGFDGVEGTDFGYTHHEVKISLGRAIGYNLYWAKYGTFYKHGNGGFINLANNAKKN